MTFQLLNVPKSSLPLWPIIGLIFHLIAYTAWQPTHCLDHLIMVHVVKIRLCILMVPIRCNFTFPWFRRKDREIINHPRIISQSLHQHKSKISSNIMSGTDSYTLSDNKFLGITALVRHLSKRRCFHKWGRTISVFPQVFSYSSMVLLFSTILFLLTFTGLVPSWIELTSAEWWTKYVDFAHAN